MRRNRNLFIAALVVAGLLVGFLATRSSSNDDDNVETTSSKNCPPVARLDAAATTPTAPVSVDVLANDTDPDGDPLVFQILKTTGGTATVDDGATPTDASDDRVLFTPAVPAPPAAVIEYQAIDPRGAIDASTVEVSINDLGTLPEETRSEAVTTETTARGRCGTGSATTAAPATTAPTSTSTSLFEAEEFDDDSDTRTTRTTRRSTTNTTAKKKSTTTTAKKSTVTTSGGGSGTTQPTSPPTTRPPTTTTTGTPPSTTEPSWGECGPPPSGSPPSPAWDEWEACREAD